MIQFFVLIEIEVFFPVFLCDIILLLAIYMSKALLFIPGLITQMIIIIILLIDCFVLYIGQWSNDNRVYHGLIPGILGCIFLNGWIMTYNHFQNVYSDKQRIGAAAAIYERNA